MLLGDIVLLQRRKYWSSVIIHGSLVCGYQSPTYSNALYQSLSLHSPTYYKYSVCPSEACLLSRPSDSRYPAWLCTAPRVSSLIPLHQLPLSSVPLVQALIADWKSTLSWAISGDSLCCLMHYFHLNKILLGTQWFKSKEELLMVRFSGIKPE